MKKTIKYLVKNNKKLLNIYKQIVYIRGMIVYKICPVRWIKFRYKQIYKIALDLENPKTLSEKLIYLNLYGDKELKVKCTDKYEVKEYLKELGYGNLVVETIKLYNNINEINFNELPNQFALKATHGCGYNIICSNKEELNWKECLKKLRRWTGENFSYYNIETHYKEIKPRIICEKYIGGLDQGLPIDYKVYCLNGKPTLTQCCLDRESELKLCYYDIEWKRLEYSSREIDKYAHANKPKNYDQMLRISSKISQQFEYVRIDFYEVDYKLFIGELTFTPAACMLTYLTREAELTLGKLLLI